MLATSCDNLWCITNYILSISQKSSNSATEIKENENKQDEATKPKQSDRSCLNKDKLEEDESEDEESESVDGHINPTIDNKIPKKRVRFDVDKSPKRGTKRYVI